MNSIVIANVILGIGILANVITMQQKEKKKILVGLIIVNVLSALSYFILKSYSAVIVNGIAIAQTYVKFFYDKKEKNIPVIMQIGFIIISIIGGIATSNNWLDILPTICLVLYTLSILQAKEKNIRLFTLFNILGWIIYDLYAKAYVGILLSAFTMTSTIIAIVRYDILKKEKLENGK